MRMCQDHWDKLRGAIDERGLTALVADHPEQAVRNLASEIEDGRSVDNFDPLMGAHNAILGNAMNVAGLALMALNEDGTERCPLCYLQAGHDATCSDPDCTHHFDTWIDHAADDMVTAWKSFGEGTKA